MAIARYNTATQTAFDAPVLSHTLKGTDKQLLVFAITLPTITTDQEATVLKWEGSGKIEAIQSFHLISTTGGNKNSGIGTIKIEDNQIKLKPTGANIAAGWKLTITLIVGV